MPEFVIREGMPSDACALGRFPTRWNHLVEEKSPQIQALGRFRPVRHDPSPTETALAAIHMEARAAAMPSLPVLHDAAGTEAFYRNVVLVTRRVRVAERDGIQAAHMATTPGWIEHLHVARWA